MGSDYSIPENWDRIYILDAGGTPVRVFDFGMEVGWKITIGKQYELYDRAAGVWRRGAHQVLLLGQHAR